MPPNKVALKEEGGLHGVSNSYGGTFNDTRLNVLGWKWPEMSSRNRRADDTERWEGNIPDKRVGVRCHQRKRQLKSQAHWSRLQCLELQQTGPELEALPVKWLTAYETSTFWGRYWEMVSEGRNKVWLTNKKQGSGLVRASRARDPEKPF